MNYKYFVILFLFSFIAVKGFAQSTPVKEQQIHGKILDSLTMKPLYGASATLIYQRDSIMHQFAWTEKEGTFQLKALPGKYLLLIAYPGYADFTTALQIGNEDKALDLGVIKLKTKAELLREVVIKGEVPMMTMNGDTVEFDPRAFKLTPNANIEEMLKQIPGFEVDSKGNIKAYGQTINKVLVDGEEFFGDDPTLVTRNLRADMIAKVQLFDKESKFTEQTGIKDGNTTKTINIKLREDKKKGFFGNLGASLGNRDLHQKQAMLNYFDYDLKVAGYGFNSNTTRTNITGSDRGRFNFSNTNLNYFNGSSLYSMVSSYGDSPIATDYSGEGFPKSTSAGLHAEDKFFNKNHKGSIDYYFNIFDIERLNTIVTRNPLNIAVLNQLDRRQVNNNLDAHRVQLKYEMKLDTLSNLNINANFSKLQNQVNHQQFSQIQSTLNGDLLVSNRNLDDAFQVQDLFFRANYSKRFKKKGRSLNAGLNFNQYQHQGDAILNNVINFEGSQGTQRINQYKVNDKEGSFNAVNLMYTEPLSKSLSAIISYDGIKSSGSILRESYNADASGQYTQLDTEFSNDFELDEGINKMNARLLWNKGQWSISGGLDYVNFEVEQTDLLHNNLVKLDEDLVLPSFSVNRFIPQVGYSNFSYNAMADLPTIEHLQPVRDNINPQQIRVGNPNLEPGRNHNFLYIFSFNKPLQKLIPYFYFNYTLRDKAIISDYTYLPSGLSTLSFTNLKGQNAHQFSFSGDLRRSFKKINSVVGLALDYQYSKSFAFFNKELIKQNGHRISPSVRYELGNQKGLMFNYRFTPSFIINESSNAQQFNNNGVNYVNSVFLNYSGYKNTIFQVTYSHSHYGATELFKATNLHAMNVVIQKDILKNKPLRVSLIANDVLNQNRGIRRSTNGLFITEDQYSIIRQSFLLGLTWNFNKFGKSKE